MVEDGVLVAMMTSDDERWKEEEEAEELGMGMVSIGPE